MKALFRCDVEYLPSPHLMQVYEGFFDLQKKGIVELHIHPKKNGNVRESIIAATINGKYRVIYDALDGICWIPEDELQNLAYFQKQFKADFYFKRSYNKQLLDYSPPGCKVFPLGLNYPFRPEKNLLFLYPTVKKKIRYFFQANKWVRKALHKPAYVYAKDFEQYPLRCNEDKILFIARLWNPKEATTEEAKEERHQLNQLRVEYIQACKQHFGRLFTGGLTANPFTNKYFSAWVLPENLTDRRTYVRYLKEHSICIATTGLHRSIPWKVGEFVAASRAIVSEPLHFEVPGNFTQGSNYLPFENSDQLLEQVEQLLKNKDQILRIMQRNFQYYHSFLRPDMLVLNSLCTVVDKGG